MSPHFPSDAGGRKFQCEVHSRFYETPFPHFQNCVTIQNKSEKNIHAMIIHTCKSKLNLFFLEPCILQLLQRDFTHQVPPVSSSSSFSSVDTYLISFSFEYVTRTPPPPSNFSTDLALFCGDWGGGRSPGYATVSSRHTCQKICKKELIFIATRGFIASRNNLQLRVITENVIWRES